jgi:hypothetical protein
MRPTDALIVHLVHLIEEVSHLGCNLLFDQEVQQFAQDSAESFIVPELMRRPQTCRDLAASAHPRNALETSDRCRFQNFGENAWRRLSIQLKVGHFFS